MSVAGVEISGPMGTRQGSWKTVSGCAKEQLPPWDSQPAELLVGSSVHQRQLRSVLIRGHGDGGGPCALGIYGTYGISTS